MSCGGSVRSGSTGVRPRSIPPRRRGGSAWPAHGRLIRWARSWLSTRDWFDGYGTPTASEREHYASHVRTGRQVLAWMLGCLASAGDHWYDLIRVRSRRSTPASAMPSRICPSGTRRGSRSLSTSGERPIASGQWWFGHGGVWYANALMVTLVTLGLVERARLGRRRRRAAGLPVDRDRPRRLGFARDRARRPSRPNVVAC